MSDQLIDYFADAKNCYKDLGQLRKLYNTTTTAEEARNAQKSLHLMYLYCPDELSMQVRSAMEELEYRMNHTLGIGWDVE